MVKSSYVNIAKPARKRSSVTGTLVGVRLQDDELKAIDKWARKQEPAVTRPYAIRRLVELGLTVNAKGRPKSQDTKRRANELAGDAIDEMADTAASPEDQAGRKRRLIKGPEEFQSVRRDRPKAERK
jgi:hypothetical protein